MRSMTLGLALTGILAAAGIAQAQTTIYGISRDNRLVSFFPATPGILNTNNLITGLGAGETVTGIDVRPLTGEIFIFGTSSRMFSVTPGGVATAVGTGYTALTATSSFDFNPTVDRVRVVDVAGGNRRLNPVTGGDIVPVNDTALTYGTGGVPRAAGVAYTNAQFGANVTMGSIRELFVDSALDTLGEIGTQAGGNPSFNGGVSSTIGALGFDLSDDAGFDIYGPNGTAYLSNLVQQTGGPANFYTLNLATGAANFVGIIGGGTVLVTDIAAIPAPAAGALLGLAAFAARRRRA